MEGITYIDNVLTTPSELFDTLKSSVNWDERMQARKTASFGVAYNYSHINYPYQAFTSELTDLVDLIEMHLYFRPNNCLINFYVDGHSSMGWHADQTDILQDGTGVAIISLGDTRILRFREITHKENKIDYPLPAGSLIYMTQEVQDRWHHAVPRSPTSGARMSLTFRRMK